jgi:hypothetical protein
MHFDRCQIARTIGIGRNGDKGVNNQTLDADVIRNRIHHKIYIEIENNFSIRKLEISSNKSSFDVIAAVVRQENPSISPFDIQDSEDYGISSEL